MSTKQTLELVGGDFNGKLLTWNLNNTDSTTGDYVDGMNSAWSDRSVQVSGTFGTGGTCVIEGSNDGVTWFTLSSPANSTLSFTQAGLKQIVEACRHVRPRITAGDGTTAIAVSLFMRIPNSR